MYVKSILYIVYVRTILFCKKSKFSYICAGKEVSMNLSVNGGYHWAVGVRVVFGGDFLIFLNENVFHV